MATITPPRAPVSFDPASSGVVFRDVGWSDYGAMLRIVGERPIRVIYDRGTMEVFMPSFGHEEDAHLLGRVVETLTDELDIPVKAGRTTTHKREDLDRGTEPNQSYWFHEKARRMVGKRQLDLAVDPPPDLVIEVDVTSSSLKRFPIFAAMGIAEVWRHAGPSLEFLHLQDDGTYQARDLSRNFPTLPVAEVARFLELGRNDEETAWVRSLRVFIRDRLAPRPLEGPDA
jgi:Uma2 family endonuclease